MGSSSKKYKDKESRKRRHRSRSRSYDEYEVPREKKHKHKKHHHHHRERKREKAARHGYQSDGSDVVEIISESPPLVERTQPLRPTERAQAPRINEKVEAARISEKVQAPRLTEKVQAPKYIEKAQASWSTENFGQSVESLSIEETNKLRAKLGLKPLDVGSSSTNNSTNLKKKDDAKKKDDLGEFYHKPAENLQEKAQQEKIRAKLAEIKEKRHLHNKYSKLKTLGESEIEDDIEAWVDKNRQIERAKKEAEKRAKMLEELDAQFGISEVVHSEQLEKMRQRYTEKDLKGLTVQHDIDSFAEERSIILTLKDKGVLDEDEDVLVNVNMLDNERYKKVC